jgi:hypothetical protein
MSLPTAIVIRHAAFEDFGTCRASISLAKESRTSCLSAFALELGQAGQGVERLRTGHQALMPDLKLARRDSRA